MRFVKLARGVTLMLGPIPRHSCQPVSQTGRGASAGARLADKLLLLLLLLVLLLLL